MHTSEELKVIKSSQKTLHDTIDVLLEALDLISLVVALQVGDDPLHVVLQVGHVVSLLTKSSLHQPLVEDEIYSRLHGLIGAFISLFSTGVGSFQDKVSSSFSGDVLNKNNISYI